jgi:hypothetical protein
MGLDPRSDEVSKLSADYADYTNKQQANSVTVATATFSYQPFLRNLWMC